MSRALAICHGPFGRATLYRLDRPMLRHAHREGHLIVQLDGPPCAVEVAGQLHSTSPGDAVAINPWEPHDFRPGPGGEGSLFLVLYVRPGWFLEASRLASSGLRFGRPQIEIAGALSRRVERVASMLAEPKCGDRLAGELYALTRQCFDQSWQRSTAARERPSPRLLDFRVRKALKLISGAVGGEVPFDRVARESGLSRPHFYKMFKSQIGITPNLYLNLLRVERALELLAAGTCSVAAIGDRLGFACQSSFTRFFAANVGLAPSDYRRSLRPL